MFLLLFLLVSWLVGWLVSSSLLLSFTSLYCAVYSLSSAHYFLSILNIRLFSSSFAQIRIITWAQFRTGSRCIVMAFSLHSFVVASFYAASFIVIIAEGTSLWILITLCTTDGFPCVCCVVYFLYFIAVSEQRKKLSRECKRFSFEMQVFNGKSWMSNEGDLEIIAHYSFVCLND